MAKFASSEQRNAYMRDWRARHGARPWAKGRKPRLVPEGTRWCSGCQAPRPVDQFTGQERTCRRCKYGNHIRRKYGISLAEYERFLEQQGGVCAICQSRPPRYVDHDHATGRARGILCQPCNTALGAFGEDPVIFQRALNYLASIARNE